jgi:hypothetical protein
VGGGRAAAPFAADDDSALGGPDPLVPTADAGSVGSVFTVTPEVEVAGSSGSSLKSELEVGRDGGTAAAAGGAEAAVVLELATAAAVTGACCGVPGREPGGGLGVLAPPAAPSGRFAGVSRGKNPSAPPLVYHVTDVANRSLSWGSCMLVSPLFRLTSRLAACVHRIEG